MDVKSVCVVGGGAAGLCAARHLKSDFEVTVLEMTSSIGGTWVYSEQVGQDAMGNEVHSSMYRDLRTNLPKETMQYPDFPFPKALPSFLSHTDILAYLRSFAEEHELMSLIHFNHKVVNVRPMVNEGRREWEVLVEDQRSDRELRMVFDAVVVCNGHFSTPKWAEVGYLEKFEGKVLHSHEYRVAESFEKQSVLVLGANLSGADIAVQVAKLANKVYVGHNMKESFSQKMPSNIEEVAFANRCLGGKVVELMDRSRVEVDAIIFCTGYLYSFPFLDPECHVSVEENVVQPLYKHVFSIHNPTLAFVGLLFRVVPNMCCDLQLRWIARVFSGKSPLPDAHHMIMDTNMEFTLKRQQGMRDRFFHSMDIRMPEYFDMLAKLAKTKKVPKVVYKMFFNTDDRRLEDISNYKRDKYIVKDNENFQCIENFYSYDK